MKRLVVLALLYFPLLLSAQEKERKIAVIVYGGVAAASPVFGEVNVSFFTGKHAIGIGPFFTKPANRSLNPGAHLSYQLYPGRGNRRVNSFVSTDYIYYSTNYENLDGSETTHEINHQITIGYGCNYRFSTRFYLTSNIGFGYMRTKREYELISAMTPDHSHWSNSGSFIGRLGIGYMFKNNSKLR